MKEITVGVDNVSVIYRSLSLRGITNHTAVDGFSHIFEPGNIYGFIGRNGAGKTTLLSAIAGYRKIFAGSVTINGENVFENSAYAPHINFIYQKNFAEDYTKVKKYLKKAAIFRPNFDMDYAHNLLERFEVPLDKRMRRLSKGHQSAVIITIGLASRCSLTIFDEAYVGMDAPNRQIFYDELIKEQEQHPRTVIMSSHLISEVEYLFDKVVIIHKGKLVQNANYDATKEMNLQDLFINLTEGEK
ncbi:MAG: ABC transporter ATP-binding protein [Defluviitaleaceae bacterium]|nr:ABC transporter ATP-binding protein [Defluviitaleaceae bacterium]